MSAAVNTLYTVSVGDSLSKLAAKFYGDSALYPKIAERNNLNANSILMIGQRIIIPPLQSEALEEVQVTAQRLPVPGEPDVQNTIETVTTTASVWYKDWRYWAGIGLGLGVVWYLTKGKR